jgi:hypothetical protein
MGHESEPFLELRKDWEHAQGPLEADPEEVLRTHLIMEVAISRPSPRPLGGNLAGNLRRCV